MSQSFSRRGVFAVIGGVLLAAAFAPSVAFAQPDLTISVTPARSTGLPNSGTPVTFDGRVSNVGSAVAAGTFNNRFEIDLGNNGSVDVTLAPSPTLTNLAAGVGSFVNSAVWTAVVGTHRVILCADQPAPVVVELNETNNCSPAGTGIFTVVQSPPTVTTQAATAITNTTATLNGNGNPNGAAATGWFRYDTASANLKCTLENQWVDITYGNGLFVAISPGPGIGNRVMTSPDGITWTIRTSAADNNWWGITYGNGLFVTVAQSGTGNRVMTSPDGITWTIRTSAADQNWTSVTYGNGFFVAVAYGGLIAGNRVMTSPDGINWTLRTSAADSTWIDITYGNGLFVAVASQGVGGLVMTSPDGITWTMRSSIGGIQWSSVTYGNGLFVAVSTANPFSRVMTSPDGINWTPRASWSPPFAPAINTTGWSDITFGNGLFVAVAHFGLNLGNRVMTSPDGIIWTLRSSAADNSWSGVTYGNGLFVAVAYTGTGNRVMTSPDGINWIIRATPLDQDAGGTRSPSFGGTALGSGSAGVNYSSAISGLTGGTTYYYCAIAANSGGNGFGAIQSFVTTAAASCSATTINNCTLPATSSGSSAGSCSAGFTGSCNYSCTNGTWTAVSNSCVVAPTIPTVTTPTATSITATGATLGANVTSTGGAALTARGTCWGTVTNPTTNCLAQGGLTTGIFTHARTGMPAGTTIYYRGYATNSVGTGYSVSVSFVTSAAAQPALTVTPPELDFGTVAPNSNTSLNFTVSNTGDAGSFLKGAVTFTDPRFTCTAGCDYSGAGIAVGSPLTTTVRFSPGATTGFVTATSTFTGTNTASDGSVWVSRTSAADNGWFGITYGNGLFVAVALTATGNGVMTSPDGITWTARATPADNLWTSVTYGNGLFVAVAASGIGNRVMTSPDGITWTLRTSATDNQWYGVTFANGLFVAVSTDGIGNRVMTSPDGITWTSRTSAADNIWLSVTYGNGLFVAVAASGIGNRVQTSPDGITWTLRTSAADNQWYSVTYGNGLFVAVAASGIGNRVMTSPDGITWTSRTSAADNVWRSVTYGNGLFVAVSSDGNGNRVMTSPDGINWTIRTSAANYVWYGVTYGNGLFVAVANNGTGNRVMTSGSTALRPVFGTVSVAAQPDLTISVDAASVPATPIATQVTTLNATARNIGTAASGATPFPNIIQIDNDSNHNTSFATATTNTITNLAASTNAPITASYTFPSSGTYYLRACTDLNASMAGVITESNEGNNCGAWVGPITVVAPLAVSCSVSPTTGTTATVFTWTAVPVGGTGSYTYSWSGTDGLSGATISVTKTYSIVTPPNKTGAVTVTSGTQTVSNQACSNQVTSVTNIAQPDLTISVDAASVPATPIATQVTTLNATARNIGTAASGATPFPNIIQIDNDSNHNTSFATATTNTITNLAASTNAPITASYTFPSSGTYYLRACTDLNASMAGVITESNEGNNCGAWVELITVAANSAPNAPTISGPVTGTAGTSYSFTFTATDPDADTIHYLIDWDNNGTVDQTLPAGYVNSGTAQSQANNWAGIGTKTFQARTQDSKGALSGWTPLTITLSPPLTVSLTANPVTGMVSFSDTLTAVVSGSATGNIDYYFWWDCAGYVGTDPVAAESACGNIPPNPPVAVGACRGNTAGHFCSQVAVTSQPVTNTYTTTGSLIPMVIVQRGGFWAQATTSLIATAPPILEVTPSQRGFSDVVIGDSTTGIFTVTNSAALSSGSYLKGVATSDNTTNFTCVSGCDYSTTGIAAQSSQVVTIRFAPGATLGGITGNITFTGTNAAAPALPIVAPVWGTGVPPISMSSGLNFGNVIVNKSKDLSLTITNVGATTLNDTLILPSTAYTCVPSCAVSVVSGGSQSMTIHFTPTALTSYDGTAYLENNPSITSAFTGRGVAGTFKFIDQ